MRKFISFVLVCLMMFSLCACGVYPDGGTHIAAQEVSTEYSAEPVKISFMAEFYNNHGGQWLAIEGTSFDIEPNKVKEYAYDSEGSWISKWTTSSVMSITVDNKHIESCGSTVLFYDTRLEKLNLDLPDEVTLSQGDKATISSPYESYTFEDTWGLSHWYWTEKQANRTPASRIVIVQSQEGDPICMFAGEEVSWSVSRNLPKTTEVIIDGKVIYIHRSNFSVVDTAIFE